MKTPAFDALSPAARDFFLQAMRDAVFIGLSEDGAPRQEKHRSLVCDRIFAQGFFHDGVGLIGYFQKYDRSEHYTSDEGLDVAELERLGLSEELLKQEDLVADMRQRFDREFNLAWEEQRRSERSP